MAGSWDEEADVVVGVMEERGASAVIAAHDAGAKVLIDLAGKLGVAEADQLAATLAEYRQACRNGRDDKFGRSRQTLVELYGDLYGLPLWPCLLNTQGGLKRNFRGQTDKATL
jgi:hypothetical protein